MPTDLVGTVIGLIQRQQSAVSGSGSLPVVQIFGPASGPIIARAKMRQLESLCRIALSRRDTLQLFCGLLKQKHTAVFLNWQPH